MSNLRTYRSVALALLLGLILAACGNTTTGSSTTGSTTAPVDSAAATIAANDAGAASPTADTDATGEAATADAAETSAATTVASSVASATNAAVGTSTAAATGGTAGTIKIGSKDFTEAILVAEIYALLLENAGIEVERNFNLAGAVANEALINGEIDMYPEYTSTGLQEILQITDRITDPQQIYERVRQGYEEQYQITWLQPSPFNDTNTFATTQAVADQYQIKTYTDLAAKAGELRLGGPAEFFDRQDTKNLQQIYGADFTFKEFVQLGTGPLRYDALQNGDVDVIVAFTTDGRIAADQLVVLEDDKSAYPIYQIAPVIRQGALAANPQIEQVLNDFAPLLDEATMSGLNFQVDGEGKDYEEVARTFLEEQGLLQ